jgi:hypothetical protein
MEPNFMTLEQIRAMFIPGQVWRAVRTPGFKGEASTITERRITEVRSKDYICTTSDTDRNRYGSFPLARDVIDVRPGYLKFNLVHPSERGKVAAVIELTLQRAEA